MDPDEVARSLDDMPETEAGRALYQELLWVHGHLRDDLAVVRRLVAELADGLPAARLGEELRALKTKSPLWQLKVGCLRYCRFVQAHHQLEDRALFPALHAANSAIGAVVARLEAEHRTISDDRDALERATEALLRDDHGPDARRAVVVALEALATNLLAHLDFEELSIGPTLRRMSSG